MHLKMHIISCCGLDFRLEEGEDVEENRRNLLSITQKVFNAIVSSADR